jgi:cytochrome P450
MPRIVLSGGMNIDGHHLPEGTVVGVSTFAIHHNSTHFPNPWEFQPERWIESSHVSSEDIKHARKAFAPFSLGTRGCPGQSLAYLQLKLTLAHMLYRYDIRDAPSDSGRGGGGPGMEEGRHRRDEYQLEDAFGFGRDGPVVQFKRCSELRELA